MKRKLVSFALACAVLASLALASTATAKEEGTLIVKASVGDVLTISVDPEGFSFGEGLNFLGANANFDVCRNPSEGGVTYLGPYTPGVVVTVQSNQPWKVNRYAESRFPENRLFVKDSRWVDCAENHTNRYALPPATEPRDYGDPTNSYAFVDFYSFDVRVGDDDGEYVAKIVYVAYQ